MSLTTLESDRLLVFKNCFCKKKDRYYAKTLSDMDTVGLLCGEQRYAARTNLEDFIDGNISYGQLKANPRHWFWQSTRHPEMVILQKWFLGEQA